MYQEGGCEDRGQILRETVGFPYDPILKYYTFADLNRPLKGAIPVAKATLPRAF
jgi:hypothetical protein